MEVQHTIQKAVALSGRGLFSGQGATVEFRPAPANHGVVFARRDLGGVEIPALIQNVVKKLRRTTLGRGDATIDTCEHCLSALAGLGIDNILIEVEGPELPAMDNSSRPYFDALQSAGLEPSNVPRRRLVITEPVVVQQLGAMVAAVPNDEPGMQLIYDLDYGQAGNLGRQMRVFDLNAGDYGQEIAPARTFVLQEEVEALRSSGIGAHLTEEDVLVIGEGGPLGNNRFRFPDEMVRHKIVDLIGDLYLLGVPIQGKIIAYRSGHLLNHSMVRHLTKYLRHQVRQERLAQKSVLDIRRLGRILPHRYPMLLVDRVVEIDEDRRIVGVKNVTINEPFFQGHYPGTPIMPGVLIVEAMAQLSGVLIGQKLDHMGKLAVLLSLDRVKLRRAVTPGDQLVLEAESVKVRSRVAHMRCRAYVGEDLAAEAEVRFMLVDEKGFEGDREP